WKKNSGCGIAGSLCSLPETGETRNFKCGAGCIDSSNVYTPRIVGTQSILYDHLVVGTGTYRLDSFICAAAIHNNVISNTFGGCVTLKMTGSSTSFKGSTSNHISSYSFDSIFPFSFTLQPCQNRCTDFRFFIIFVNIVTLYILAYLIESADIACWLTMIVIYFTVSLVSDPPETLHAEDPIATLISISIKRLLPLLAVLFIVYKYILSFAINKYTSKFELLIEWITPIWIGAMFNFTFDKLPVDRFLLSDITSRPGSLLTICVTLIVLVVCIVIQLRAAMESKHFRFLVMFYSISLPVLVLIAIIAYPHLILRFHHYIIALYLLPSTMVHSRVTLVYQGILLGMCINGVARWGFASILETAALIRRDGPAQSMIPNIESIDVNDMTIHLKQIDGATSLTGFSLLLNDVEVYRGSEPSFQLPAFLESTELFGPYEDSTPWY
ncbi:hypothetical protein CANCADRAFT_13663, partial [Tortispora caseinolytica NRRL Y-17796]